ncbi:MAG TPA: putative metal-binding motif-containing protein, partial [Sandaracinaceae bacterium]
APCSTDADCDDGLFCTGTEACVEGRCVQTPVVCDDGVACTRDFCSEERGRCISAPPDLDGDGYGDASCLDDRGEPLGNDCDDTDPNRFPGNLEVCDADGHDEDCDPSTHGGVDADGDGYESSACCNPGPDGTPQCGPDCDDARGAVHPLGTEVCDGLDQDCDGVVDEEVAVAGFADMDFDGRGDDSAPRTGCPGTPGFAVLGGDCDDTNFAISPDQPEICDGIRNDCTALPADEGAMYVDWYVDLDGDGFGSPRSGVIRSCVPVPNASLRGTDCDDTNPAIHPGAAELCDGLDNDCNGAADFAIGPHDFEDDDGDGYVDRACAPVGNDCNDADPASGPGEPERCNGLDDDCDGAIDEGSVSYVYYRDRDGDGYGSVLSGTIVTCLGMPGYSAAGGDCNDEEPRTFPGATERCNYRDDDCDGAIDEAPTGGPLFCGYAVVDQYNYGGGTLELNVAPHQRFGQRFRIGMSGQLVGLDIVLHRAGFSAEPGFAVVIDVMDPSGAVVATRRFLDGQVPAYQYGLELFSDGPLYIDLTSAELMVTEGETWSFLVRVEGTGTCILGPGGMNFCEGRGMPCSTAADCGP